MTSDFEDIQDYNGSFSTVLHRFRKKMLPIHYVLYKSRLVKYNCLLNESIMEPGQNVHPYRT